MVSIFFSFFRLALFFNFESWKSSSSLTLPDRLIEKTLRRVREKEEASSSVRPSFRTSKRASDRDRPSVESRRERNALSFFSVQSVCASFVVTRPFYFATFLVRLRPRPRPRTTVYISLLLSSIPLSTSERTRAGYSFTRALYPSHSHAAYVGRARPTDGASEAVAFEKASFLRLRTCGKRKRPFYFLFDGVSVRG